MLFLSTVGRSLGAKTQRSYRGEIWHESSRRASPLRRARAGHRQRAPAPTLFGRAGAMAPAIALAEMLKTPIFQESGADKFLRASCFVDRPDADAHSSLYAPK